MRLSIQTIEAIVEVVTGGSGSSTREPIGIYRSGPELEQFFRALGIEFRVGGSSRVPAVREKLNELCEDASGDSLLVKVIEAAADPRDFLDDPGRLEVVQSYLNTRLELDGFQLEPAGNRYRVVSNQAFVSVLDLDDLLKSFGFSTARRDFDKAIQNVETDPADSITSACSTLESVCKCILDEIGCPYPQKKDIKPLATEVSRQLNLSPGRSDLPADWEADIRHILTGLVSVAAGVGALRTHTSDAHGRGKREMAVDARIARLAVQASATLSMFFIETWQKNHG